MRSFIVSVLRTDAGEDLVAPERRKKGLDPTDQSHLGKLFFPWTSSRPIERCQPAPLCRYSEKYKRRIPSVSRHTHWCGVAALSYCQLCSAALTSLLPASHIFISPSSILPPTFTHTKLQLLLFPSSIIFLLPFLSPSFAASRFPSSLAFFYLSSPHHLLHFSYCISPLLFYSTSPLLHLREKERELLCVGSN